MGKKIQKDYPESIHQSFRAGDWLGVREIPLSGCQWHMGWSVSVVLPWWRVWKEENWVLFPVSLGGVGCLSWNLGLSCLAPWERSPHWDERETVVSQCTSPRAQRLPSNHRQVLPKWPRGPGTPYQLQPAWTTVCWWEGKDCIMSFPCTELSIFISYDKLLNSPIVPMINQQEVPVPIELAHLALSSDSPSLLCATATVTLRVFPPSFCSSHDLLCLKSPLSQPLTNANILQVSFIHGSQADLYCPTLSFEARATTAIKS